MKEKVEPTESKRLFKNVVVSSTFAFSLTPFEDALPVSQLSFPCLSETMGLQNLVGNTQFVVMFGHFSSVQLVSTHPTPTVAHMQMRTGIDKRTK